MKPWSSVQEIFFDGVRWGFVLGVMIGASLGALLGAALVLANEVFDL